MPAEGVPPSELGATDALSSERSTCECSECSLTRASQAALDYARPEVAVPSREPTGVAESTPCAQDVPQERGDAQGSDVDARIAQIEAGELVEGAAVGVAEPFPRSPLGTYDALLFTRDTPTRPCLKRTWCVLSEHPEHVNCQETPRAAYPRQEWDTRTRDPSGWAGTGTKAKGAR